MHKHVERLVTDVAELFGNNFALTMEQYLTHLEQLRNVHNNYRMRGRPGENPYLGKRETFLRVLTALLDQSIGRQPDCLFHKKLVNSLDAQDAILSFNYDWLIDHTLSVHGKGKWNPTHGYGVSLVNSTGEGWKRWAYKDENGKPQHQAETLKLLKMHGSMTWFKAKKKAGGVGKPKLKLRQRWWKQRGNPEYEIVPPEWQKATDTGIYQDIWQKARTQVCHATNMAFLGYSMPETDLPVRALFMVDASSAKKLKNLVLVNPDGGARRRIRAVLNGRMAKKTRVLSFDTLEEFAGFLDA